ncbi:MAG TPA: alpha/beta hydrolase [Bryobacteraceae bacterium]|nr:alpha/beta hydrolase [Bryobacteraceae bacterium]
MLVLIRAFLTTALLAASLFAAAKYDGARVHYESYGQGKDAVVYIHGWTCDLTFWRANSK